MKIYLAGGYTGNLKPLWDNFMKICLAGTLTRQYCLEEAMKLYLAGKRPVKNGTLANWRSLNILESFYYVRKNKRFPLFIKDFGCFLLDSGAFTFMSNTQKCGKADFEQYVREYAVFINQYNIQHFFELDIDSVVGLKEVERLRTLLENLTGKKPIPVWHKSRGIEYFKQMCKNYPYVALGGIVTKEIPTIHYEKMFPWFINEAHKNGCKIHGLGYTNLKGLHKFHFDSVDSTAWLYGNRGGFIYKFNPSVGTISQINAPDGCKLKGKEAALYNFNEWVKFQKYADKYL